MAPPRRGAGDFTHLEHTGLYALVRLRPGARQWSERANPLLEYIASASVGSDVLADLVKEKHG